MNQGQPLGKRQGLFARALNSIFPERQIFLRTEGRISFIRLSRGLQISLVALLAATGGWTAYASVTYSLHGEVIAYKDSQIANARLAYASLLAEVAEYQRRFTAVVHDLEDNHSLMLGLVEKNASLQKSLRSVENQLETTEHERESVIGTREMLKTQLYGIEEKMRGLANHNFNLRDNLDSVESGLQKALTERNRALDEGDLMRRHIAKLDQRLLRLQESEEDAVGRLTQQTVAFIDSIEKLVDLTGLDVQQVVSAVKGLPEGQGGPFIEFTTDGLPADRLKADLANLSMYLDRWEALQSAMRRLPLTAPLNYYYITSGYGKRRDPINKKWAAHYGVDLGGTFKSSVYATAPGVVTFAGWNGKYGKMVELDHGAGIKTRFGHLHQTLVEKGQKVKFRDKIGLLGSTGRSTGAHLHYEILFFGRPKDPMQFIKAGRYVFQG